MDKRHAMHFARAECAPLLGAALGTSQTVNQSEVFEIAAGIIALSEWEPAPDAVRDFNGADGETGDFDDERNEAACAKARLSFGIGAMMVGNACDFLACNPSAVEGLDVERLRENLRGALALLS